MNSTPSPLKIELSWSNLTASVYESDDPSKKHYVLDFNKLAAPHLEIKSAADNQTIGTGTIHPVSINADYELHGQKGILKARRRFKTVYDYISTSFSDDGSPTTMTWNDSYGLKHWDFICLDDNQVSVARFSMNMWAAKKIGVIEFMGPRTKSQELRDELVVTGTTLFYCMLLRSTNILNFFGAFFAKTGPIGGKPAAASKKVKSTARGEEIGSENRVGEEMATSTAKSTAIEMQPR